MEHLTPLRYPGGKARLAGFVATVLRLNNLLDAHYVEPYAGGASVALALLFGEFVRHIHINDLDRSVYAFWHCVLHKTDELCHRIRDVELSVAEWKRQRAIQAYAKKAGLFELGFSTFYLNRTNRSGIISSGGVIGGLAQTGRWKIGARFYRKTLIDRIEAIALYRDRISIYNRDAAVFVRALLPRLPVKSILFLDPPYYIKGKRRLYASCYDHSDHLEIAHLLSKVQCHWLVSYDDVPQVRSLYSGFSNLKYRLPYKAQQRYEGAETVFLSHRLIAPARVNLSS